MPNAPILVTGGSGQLAWALDASAQAHGIPILRVGRPQFDFERPESIAAIFAAVAPSLVVNTASYTAVDAAESDVVAATIANQHGPAQLARLCERTGISLIHLSTDYVFDGTKGAPYEETDQTAPLGIYGATKLEGEHLVLAHCSRSIVLRTSWLYSSRGKNFVRTMLRLGCQGSQLRVVADQKGCPTSAKDLAEAIWIIVTRLRNTAWAPRYHDIYHIAGTGSASWHEFACAVFEEAERHGLSVPPVTAIATADWPTPARRPADSRLDCKKIAEVFGVCLPAWRPSLAKVVDGIFATCEGQS